MSLAFARQKAVDLLRAAGGRLPPATLREQAGWGITYQHEVLAMMEKAGVLRRVNGHVVLTESLGESAAARPGKPGPSRRQVRVDRRSETRELMDRIEQILRDARKPILAAEVARELGMTTVRAGQLLRQLKVEGRAANHVRYDNISIWRLPDAPDPLPTESLEDEPVQSTPRPDTETVPLDSDERAVMHEALRESTTPADAQVTVSDSLAQREAAAEPPPAEGDAESAILEAMAREAEALRQAAVRPRVDGLPLLLASLEQAAVLLRCAPVPAPTIAANVDRAREALQQIAQP